jgi:predicted ABC-type exoprotein transport system permease subunit
MAKRKGMGMGILIIIIIIIRVFIIKLLYNSKIFVLYIIYILFFYIISYYDHANQNVCVRSWNTTTAAQHQKAKGANSNAKQKKPYQSAKP